MIVQQPIWMIFNNQELGEHVLNYFGISSNPHKSNDCIHIQNYTYTPTNICLNVP